MEMEMPKWNPNSEIPTSEMDEDERKRSAIYFMLEMAVVVLGDAGRKSPDIDDNKEAEMFGKICQMLSCIAGDTDIIVEVMEEMARYKLHETTTEIRARFKGKQLISEVENMLREEGIRFRVVNLEELLGEEGTEG